MMASELFCSKCGLAIPLDDVNLQPCIVCGNAVFVPQRWISWEAGLTEDDRKFLRIQKIAIT
jgi:predicted nucleic acid-binding Zn ribbon protein